MKKISLIKKLDLKKNVVSNLETLRIKGGFDADTNNTTVCSGIEETCGTCPIASREFD